MLGMLANDDTSLIEEGSKNDTFAAVKLGSDKKPMPFSFSQ
jgi:hypothetical protein